MAGRRSAILNEAKAIQADLIVVGGYGHSRFREWALGGATREVVVKFEIPVLMPIDTGGRVRALLD